MPTDRDSLIELVAEDVRRGLDGVFEFPDAPLSILDTFEGLEEPIASAVHDVLPWQWEVRHVGSLAGIPPTGQFVTIRAVTIVDHRGDEPVFHRFVDWLGVLDQLGAVVVTRPPVEAFPGDLPERDRFGVLEGERLDGYGERADD